MSTVNLTISRDSISPKLKKCFSMDTTPVVRAMGTTFKSITEGNFNSVGSQFRPSPWSAKKDGSPATLQLTGLMSRSFHLAITKDTATLSNPTPYAARHQFGDTNFVAGKKTGTVKTKYANKAYKGSFQDVISGSKGIPPRPFYPILNGKLTPAAADLITKAGHRAAARLLSAGEHEV